MLRLCTLISRHDLARLALPVGQCTWRACCPSSSRVHTIEDAAQITFAAATASDWTWRCSVLRRRDHIPWTTKAGCDHLPRRTPGDFPQPTRINDSDDRAGVLEVRRGVGAPVGEMRPWRPVRVWRSGCARIRFVAEPGSRGAWASPGGAPGRAFAVSPRHA